MSHSRWKRNFRDGIGRVYSGFVQFVLGRSEMDAGGSTVPGPIWGMVDCGDILVVSAMRTRTESWLFDECVYQKCHDSAPDIEEMTYT